MMKGNFNTIISGELPVLVDFHADWCGPCKAQAPILMEVAGETRGVARIIKIDVDQNRELAQKYQVRGVPTLVLFRNGQLVWRQSGVQSKQEILQAIRQNT